MVEVVEKKKREKAEDFIGWKSPDGKLEVIEIAGRQWTNVTYKVTCTECSKDKELFPDGYFVSLKGHLVNGLKPCGCARTPRWKDWQYLILARRAAKDRFIVRGFAEEFQGQRTKLNLECLKDSHKWNASISDIINHGSGCPKCTGNIKYTEQEVLQKCIDICKEMDYDVVGFPEGYKNRYSRFEYNCKIHGKQNVSYRDFVYSGTRCIGCWKDRQKELGNGNGYYPKRKDEVDNLYVLNFGDKFIKVGRSFNVDKRIKELRYQSGIEDINEIKILTGTHQEVYDLEQKIHSELRERNFQYYVGWSMECFQNDSLYILNKMLDECGLEEVNI